MLALILLELVVYNKKYTKVISFLTDYVVCLKKPIYTQISYLIVSMALLKIK